MEMLENCIEKIYEKADLTDYDRDKELYKSIYYHLCDYKDILNKSIELSNEIGEISKRWELVRRLPACCEKANALK